MEILVSRVKILEDQLEAANETQNTIQEQNQVSMYLYSRGINKWCGFTYSSDKIRKTVSEINIQCLMFENKNTAD